MLSVRFLYIASILICLTIGYAVALAEDNVNTEIDPFISKDYIKAPEAMCNYEGITAGCDQLIITLYRKNDNVINPAKEDIIYLKEIIHMIKNEGGQVIGQIKDLAILQIGSSPTDKLRKLKKKLEISGYVKSADYNEQSMFLK